MAEELRNALCVLGVPDDAIADVSDWRDGVHVLGVGALARDGEDYLGEDRDGNVIRWPSLAVGATVIAVEYWLDRRVSTDRAATLAPVYRRARAWYPEWGAGEAWSRIVELGWTRPTLNATDVWAALDALVDPAATPTADRPVVVQLVRDATDATLSVLALVPDERTGQPYVAVQPSRERRLSMAELLAVAADATSRDDMADRLRQRVTAAIDDLRGEAFTALRVRWSTREQWTTRLVADHCGVSASTYRGYVGRFGAPGPLPWWAIGRDAGQGGLYDAAQVRVWHANRAGQGARTDLTG